MDSDRWTGSVGARGIPGHDRPATRSTRDYRLRQKASTPHLPRLHIECNGQPVFRCLERHCAVPHIRWEQREMARPWLNDAARGQIHAAFRIEPASLGPIIRTQPLAGNATWKAELTHPLGWM